MARTTTKPAARTSAKGHSDGPGTGTVTWRTESANMERTCCGAGALRLERGDGCALSIRPGNAPGLPTRLADGLGLESTPVPLRTFAPRVGSHRPSGSPVPTPRA